MLSFETLIVRWVFGIVASLQQKIRDGLMSKVPIMTLFVSFQIRVPGRSHAETYGKPYGFPSNY
jgi:hypothetical protein